VIGQPAADAARALADAADIARDRSAVARSEVSAALAAMNGLAACGAMTMALGDECGIESNAEHLSGRALAWLDDDQRGTRSEARVRDMALALMRCRS